MIRLKKRKNLSVGIMISPMIDMSFLLLVFFIVSTMNMNEVKTLPVKLPQASQVEVDTKSLYHVTVLPDGRLFLEDKPLTKEAFLLWGRKAVIKDRNVSVVVYGDGKTNYQQILDVLDLLKEAGITRVGMAAERR